MIADNARLNGPAPIPQPATPSVQGTAGRWGGAVPNPTENVQGPTMARTPTIVNPYEQTAAVGGSGAAPGTLPAGARTAVGEQKKYPALISAIQTKQQGVTGDSFAERGATNGDWENRLNKLNSMGVNPETQPVNLLKAFVRGDSESQASAYFEMMQNLSTPEKVAAFNKMFGPPAGER